MSEDDKIRYEIKNTAQSAKVKFIQQYERDNRYEEGELDRLIF